MFKIVADENIHYFIIKELRSNGFKVISIMEEKNGINDKEVLEFAKQQNALLLTEDRDFGILIFAYREETLGIIFLRYHHKEFANITKSLIKVLNQFGNSLYGKFVTLTINKVKIKEI